MRSFSADLVLSVTLLLVLLATRACAQPQQGQVPCFFIFGDSLVDNGNNNRLVTLSRANYRPYGIDFPQGVTGRFTNGRTYVDALGKFRFMICTWNFRKEKTTMEVAILCPQRENVYISNLTTLHVFLQLNFLGFEITSHPMREPGAQRY